MLVTTTLAIIVTCGLCLAIRVPTTWEQNEPNSEVNNDNVNFSVENIEPQTPTKQIPVEYFEYTAKKPQFAAEIAAFHGVKSPENHYKAYPIEPYTVSKKPELGRHKVVNEELHRPIKEYGEINEDSSQAEPVSSSYEVFHPYQAEIPALQELYKDPVMTKIRNDLEHAKNRLQKYENEAGEPNISKDEYLESHQQTDGKLFPHKNIPAPYEIHRPQRRPIYYRPRPIYNPRDQYLNHKLRHPWNQYVKVRPAHYRPLKNHIHHLRQNHARKYDDERNEYPQVQALENYSEPKDGYDIYERGRDKYVKLRNNVDESINRAVQENQPATYAKLEMQNSDSSSEENEEDDEEEFVPIKNYAQVRRTETFKHLPRSAALEDAETYDEIRNAPRLREAVKSTKAQTVYSEEGYEDAAYDHAGEQKHASENEGHGGYLKQHELSGGKYKTPSVSGSNEDSAGSIYRDKLVHNKEWKDDNLDTKEEEKEEDYSEAEAEHEHALEADNYQDTSKEDENQRSKRENDFTNDTDNNSSQSNKTEELSDHEVDKREANFEVGTSKLASRLSNSGELDLNSTFLTDKEIIKISKLKLEPKKEDITQKYPYYFKNIKSISQHSPLRYAENLKFIPKKTKGGTEFYDSKSKFVCPEVEDVPDPIPEKLKDGANPDETDSVNKGEENFDTVKKQPRLGGLGDKIDCFKAKYFGENPLDSPFFKEEIISNPEPVTAPNIGIYKLIKKPTFDIDKELNASESKLINVFDKNQTNFYNDNTELYNLINKLRNDTNKKKEALKIPTLNFTLIPFNFNVTKPTPQTNIYTDILSNIRNNLTDIEETDNRNVTNIQTDQTDANNITYNFYNNKEDIIKETPALRKKRATSFVYEPYKIIKDGQVQDSKKVTTTSNISPLIKQLQSSRVAERVAKSNQDNDDSDKHVKRNVNSRTYTDIGRKERQKGSKNDKPSTEIVDVNVDKRRGEPTYEVRHSNHKSRYTPVENKKAMSIEDYKSQTGNETTTETSNKTRRPTTAKPYFDVSKFIPQLPDIQNMAASNTVRKSVRSTTTTPKTTDSPDDDDYEEYDDDEEEDEDEEIITTTSTTTTPKPSFRRRIRTTTSTEKFIQSTEKPILQLVTRFRDYKHETTPEKKSENIEKPSKENTKNNEDDSLPKYREKKRKSTKSTLVTDTKKYGDNDEEDDMRKEEVDAMIGVKQDIDEYMPSYERRTSRKLKQKATPDSAEDNHEDDKEEDVRKNDEEEDEEEEENDDENDDETDEDDDPEEFDDDEDDEEDSDENEDEEEVVEEDKITSTTPEPTKRTLSVTTDAPKPTTASRFAKLELKPLVTKKKIEIHKEIPVNTSSPHITQFKQDIKEVEIVKEMVPKRKRPNKNIEALELYKDDKLAEQVNKLGAVEVFKENLDLNSGPKHGGNYKSLTKENSDLTQDENLKNDAETSQSQFKKQVEIDEDSPNTQLHGGHLKINAPESRRRSKSSKFNEKSDDRPSKGNRNKERVKSEKLIELEEENSEEELDSDSREERYTTKHRPMHGGNYRSADLRVKEDQEIEPARKTNDGRRNAAVFLDTFARAVPILTTTPGYILDPSKRMYYYVDA